MNALPQTGTTALLQALSPHLKDDAINDLFPRHQGRGRRSLFRPAQLFRVLLLNLLTPVHSFNLLVQLLPEHRPWRDFARLPNKRVLPDAKMLHQFRDRLEPMKLRAINHHLLRPLLAAENPARKSVVIIDATDLPAATHSFKKKIPGPTRRIARPSVHARSRAGRAGGTLATKSTPCDCGCLNTRLRFCSCRS